MPALTFHVPPDARPTSMQALLTAVSRHSDGAPQRTVFAGETLGQLSRQSVLDDMAAFGSGESRPRGEVITLARDLGILAEQKVGLSATPRLAALVQSRCAFDLVHGLQYLSWSATDAARLSRMWTYRCIVDLLWDAAPVTVDAHCKKRLVEELLNRSEREFAAVPGFDAARTSIGPKSIDGVLCWLRALSPTVTHDGQLARRQTCPPPLLVLAVAGAAHTAGAQAGTDFRLIAEQRAFICRCCFLEPRSLDRMLEWTVQTQPRHLRWGTLVSTYGRQIVLAQAELGPEDLA